MPRSLAARAALVRGDRFGAVRLLEQAVETADPAFPPLTEVWAIRELADDELDEILDKVAVPRCRRPSRSRGPPVAFHPPEAPLGRTEEEGVLVAPLTFLSLFNSVTGGAFALHHRLPHLAR